MLNLFICAALLCAALFGVRSAARGIVPITSNNEALRVARAFVRSFINAIVPAFRAALALAFTVTVPLITLTLTLDVAAAAGVAVPAALALPLAAIMLYLSFLFMEPAEAAARELRETLSTALRCARVAAFNAKVW